MKDQFATICIAFLFAVRCSCMAIDDSTDTMGTSRRDRSSSGRERDAWLEQLVNELYDSLKRDDLEFKRPKGVWGRSVSSNSMDSPKRMLENSDDFSMRPKGVWGKRDMDGRPKGVWGRRDAEN